jgi:hypothetical protein
VEGRIGNLMLWEEAWESNAGRKHGESNAGRKHRESNAMGGSIGNQML